MSSLFWAKPLGFGAVASVMLMFTVSPHAQQDPLSAICQGFLSSSGVPAPGNADILCACLVREVQSNLDASEMKAYQSATQAGRTLPSGVESKITAIAVKCLGQAQ
ncbi:MAG: hypothetical protein GKS03_07475 [Alphaproteobacteria bacterium]|nr:hypothetical protein [Alphaproteobacteria bacterium]